MKELSEAILGNVREEARAIVQSAEEEAKREVQTAKNRREERIMAEKARRLADAKAESARIVAQGVMAARNKVAAAKSEVIGAIIDRARTELLELPAKPESLGYLIHDAISGLGATDKITIGVRNQDLELAKKIVAGDPVLAKAVATVAERPVGGGVVAETENGATVVDNTHAARLEMLVPRVIIRFGKELF